VLEELDVSGGAAFERRPGLSRAVQLVEADEADVLVVADFDRLVRSLSVQKEVAAVGVVAHDRAGDQPPAERRPNAR
jgi:DNA invertase Pin-like site-specific DNA recombinase